MFALHYTPVKTPTEESKIFGLQVAVLDWVKAYFRYGKQEKFYALIGDVAGQKEIEEVAVAAGIDSARVAMLDQRFPRENFGKFDVIFRADPDSRGLLWQRQQLLEKRFAFCSLAHAVSGIEGGTVLEQYCLAPSDGSDAVVCPSRALAAAISAHWENYADYLRARFGASFKCPVQLPVIPLGIDVEKIAARVTPEKRADQRAKLGLNDMDIVLLWVGRLSHAIKAHPLAMFQAAEQVAEETGASVHLVMQGYFVPKEADAQFAKLAQDVCKKAKVTFIASDAKHFPDGLWAAGDIFLSLIDNMQESFGLTPIEAMAAGLPRILSDWDGYRDSVRHGEDGFLVRTMTPPSGAGRELADLLLNGREIYGGFLAKTALCTAVDQGAAVKAIKTLIQDKNFRSSMAEKAKQRAREIYDWRSIIPLYEALWRSQSQRRVAQQTDCEWPVVPDPFAMFASYSTAQLSENTKLNVAASIDSIRMLLGHDMNSLALDMMMGPEDVTKLVASVVAAEGISIGDLFRQFGKIDKAALWRTLGWLIKLGVFQAG